jgi:TonB-dependent receptor
MDFKSRARARRAIMWAGVSALAFSLAAGTALAQTAPTNDSADVAKPTTTLKELVVTGRRKALENATERKRNSDTVIDSIVAEEAGKLPDTSLTEVLQRVSGVTITRFASLGSPDQYSFEGTGVQVRGLAGVTGLLNGREIFSANGGSGLNWGDVTPELMAEVDVYKESTADLIEGGTGGAIDLRTRMPFDYKKPELDFTLQGAYGDYVQRGAPSGSILVTDRWQTPVGEFGALLDLSTSEYRVADSFIRNEPFYGSLYQATPTSTPQKVYIPGGFDWGEDQYDRKRKGVYAAFQWRPTDTLTLWQTDFYSNYQQTNAGGGVFVAFGGSPYVAPGTGVFNAQGIFQKGVVEAYGSNPNYQASISPGSAFDETPSNNSTADFSQGFIWTPTSKLRISGAAQVVVSGAFAGDYGYGLGTTVNSVNMNLTGNLPIDQIGPGYVNGQPVSGAVLNSAPSNSYVSSINWRETKNTAMMEAENIDVAYDLGDGFFKQVKAGLRYANQSETDTATGTYWSGTDESWSGGGLAAQKSPSNSPASDFVLNPFPNFFQGKIPVPSGYYFVNPALLTKSQFVADQNYFSYGQCYYSGCAANGQWNGTNLSYLGAPTFTTTQTQKFDAYLETKFASDAIGWLPKFSGNIGVRLVSDRVTSQGNFTEGGSGCGTSFYPSVAAAAASLAQYGGLAGYLAAQTAANVGGGCFYPSGTNHLEYQIFTRSEGFHYTRALPSFNIAFKPDNTWVVRLAGSQTISPPNFTDISAQGSTGVNANTPNPGNGTVNGHAVTLPGIFTSYGYTGGNTQLNPATSTNEDLSIEWYPKSGTTAHIDFFNKDIKDLIVYNPGIFNETFPVVSSTGAITQYTGIVQATQDQNATKTSTVKGVEIGGRTYFDMLPGLFKGFGVEANYTFIDSHSPSQLAIDINGNPINRLPIPALSQTNYNVNLLYDLGKWDGRLAYSWRSKYLATTTGNGTGNGAGSNSYAFEGGAVIDEALPVWAAAYGQLDGSVSYKINPHFSLSFDVSNITDTTVKTLMETFQGEFQTRSWFISDRRFVLTLHGTF